MPCMANATSNANNLEFEIGRNIFPKSCETVDYAVPQSGLSLLITPQLGTIAFIEIRDTQYGNNNLDANAILSFRSQEAFRVTTGKHSNNTLMTAYYFDEQNKLDSFLSISAKAATSIQLRIAYANPSPEFAESLDSVGLLWQLHNQLISLSLSPDALLSVARQGGFSPLVNMDFLCPESEATRNNL